MTSYANFLMKGKYLDGEQLFAFHAWMIQGWIYVGDVTYVRVLDKSHAIRTKSIRLINLD